MAYLIASVCLFLVSGCFMQDTSLSLYSETSGQENTTPVSSLTSPETTPPQTSQAATDSAAPDPLGVIDIQDGDMLERDIIPQLATVFLNRLSAKSKLQSCVTAEYAPGFLSGRSVQ